MRIRTTLTLAGLALLQIAAAPHAARPRFSVLSNHDGLSQMSVQAIAQDAQGFLWIGTADGLNRYDGVEFKVYRTVPGDRTSLGENNISALAASPGVLWVGTNGEGLDRLDLVTERFTHFRFDPKNPRSLGSARVTDLALGARGNVWVALGEQGLDHVDAASGRIVHFRHDAARPESLASDAVAAVVTGRDGTVWAATDAGLDRIEPAHGAIHHLASEDAYRDSPGVAAPTALGTDRAGGIWLGSRGPRIERLDPGTGALRPYALPEEPERPPVLEIVEDLDGVLWASVRNRGLLRIDPASGDVRMLRHSESDAFSLSFDEAMRLLVDRAGDLWAGTWGGGVSRLDRRGSFVDTYRYSPKSPATFPPGDVRALYEDRAGRILASIALNGIVRIDPATGVAESYASGPHAPERWENTWDFLPEGEDLWLATDSGLKRIEEATGRSVPPAWLKEGHPLFRMRIAAIARDRSGDFYLATHGDGVARVDPRTGVTRFYKHDPGDAATLPANRVEHVLVDSKGRLWAGLIDAGFGELDPASGRFRSYRHDVDDPRSLADDDVQRIFEAEDGALWLCLEGGGVDRFDPKTGVFKNYSTRLGLPNDVAYAAQADAQGRVWVSTNFGIARIDPRTDRILRWDFRDGLQDHEFNFASVARGASGTLYFGGVSGLNAIRPWEVLADDDRPPVVLTSFAIRNREARLPRAAPYLREVTLRHDQSFFSIGFASVGFRRADKMRYTYRLEGLDHEPVVTTRRSASYTDVRPGRYVFRVSAENTDGRSAASEALLAIRVLPPWWATWWMRAVYGLSLLAGLVAVHFGRVALVEREKKRLEETVAVRTRELREVGSALAKKNDELVLLNEERGELMDVVAHDLKNPLGVVVGYMGLVTDEELPRSQVTEYAKRTLRTTRRMLDLVRDLLEESAAARGDLEVHPARVDLAELTREVVESNGAAEAKGQRLAIEGLASAPVLADRALLREVIENLLSNAVKFSPPGGAIRVAVSAGAGTFRCAVADSGPGISAEEQKLLFRKFARLSARPTGGEYSSGLGLALTKSLVTRMGGRVWCESEPGQGATFLVELPEAAASGEGPPAAS